MLRSLIAIGMLLPAACQDAISAGAGNGQQLVNGIGALVDARWVATRCPGLSVAIGRKNAIVYSRAFGVADVEQKVAMQVHSVDRLASVSKPMTGTIVMDLVQRGALALDPPVRRYLLELPDAYAGVTIRHLLTHQAGVRGYRDLEEVFSAVHYATSRDAVRSFAADPLLFAPGTRAAYSTFGFTLLGAAAESATGKTFQTVATEFFERYRPKGFDLDDSRAVVPGPCSRLSDSERRQG